MEPQIYFIRESPDFNFCIWGKPERIATNRVILCTMTEYGLCNDRRMSIREYSSFIETQQMTTGTVKEEPKVFMKTIPLCFSSTTLPNDVSIECTA
jgi:hypothetical protein